MWMKDGQGLVATLLGPSVLNTTLSNTAVSITETTEYPFDNSVAFQISAKSHIRFSLKIRKPQWAIAVRSSLPYKEVNGYLVFDQVWNLSTKLVIDFTSEISKKITVKSKNLTDWSPQPAINPRPSGRVAIDHTVPPA
jgi:DUF1680 family protein